VTIAARQHFTFDEYLWLEEMSKVKHEFLDGQVWAMSGGTPDHAAITANVIILLGKQLGDRPCRVFSSDLRIRVQATGLGTYPDVSVVCGKLELDPEDRKGHTVINPCVVVEVLSPSTEDYDRGEKLSNYKRIPSVEEIVLVAHDEHRLEVWRRDGERWSLGVAHGEERVTLRSVACELPLAEVYRNPLGA
jgi:Uma2 family endonuclease